MLGTDQRNLRVILVYSLPLSAKLHTIKIRREKVSEH
jgi:hypothetical protein